MSPFSGWLLAAALLAPALSGCAPAPPVVGATVVPEVVDLRAAIASARRDAAFQFGGDWVEQTIARQDGRFWVVELYAKSGAHVRYAISTRDGGIRERAVLK